MILGEINTLKISRSTDVGMFLKNEEGDEVMLPTRFAPKKFEIDQDIEVFIHNDSEGRLVATTLKPIVTINNYALLTCRDITAIGAFMDIGVMKDVLVPKKNQSREMTIGDQYMVLVYVDHVTNRLVGSTKLGAITNDIDGEINPEDEVEILVWEETPIGWHTLVNEDYQGMIYKNQTFVDIKVGQKLNGYVNRIREDGKLDLLLQKPGFASVGDASKTILDRLKDNNGFLSLTDKSDPELIYSTLGLSKKAFKKAVGGLYKKRVIKIEKEGLRLLKKH